MESHKASIDFQVNRFKKEIFSNFDLYSSVSPSAYDTAWLAMIPDAYEHEMPMFKSCLDWILDNQKDLGFWGESDENGNPTLDCLPSTLACMVALKKWNIGSTNIDKGLGFMDAYVERLLTMYYEGFPRWFTIVFPAMLDLAMANGLHIVFPEKLEVLVMNIFSDRQQIAKEPVHKCQHPPLLSYLETLPMSYDVDHQDILKHLSEDGSLFHSPSATAQAFMLTKNNDCLAYLKSVVQTCPNGVPSIYPVDEELVKLIMVNHIERLGLSEHFNEEIEEILSQIHRNLGVEETWEMPAKLVPSLIYKEALAFRLLRMNGYHISSRRFCWFLQDKDIVMHIERSCIDFLSTMYCVYRATDIIFSGEDELEKARSFSRKILERAISLGTGLDNVVVFPNCQRMIGHELSLPWLARLDHLDHRMWIEANQTTPLCTGKASFYRLLCLNNRKLMQLAMDNYKFRQLIYMKELEQIIRWTKEWGLFNIGFGREKSTYCYFSFAASCSLPYNSDLRKIIAKSATVITVADDFYDMEGSLDELRSLTRAVQRWDGTGLTGAGKTIFDALHEFVRDTAAKHLSQKGSDITKYLQKCWGEIFDSWMKEAEWSKSRATPSTDEYLQKGMISIAAHILALTGSSFLNSSLPNEKLWNDQYHTLTKLLMVTTRLLNDIQSYQKEEEDGKMNMVLLYLKENPEADVKDSIAHIRDFLEAKKKELLEHVFRSGSNDLPASFKHLHLSCFNIFQMFFHSKNRFDSDTEMLHDIAKAIFVPIEVQKPQPLKILPLQPQPKKETLRVTARLNPHETTRIIACPNPHFTQHGSKSFMLKKMLARTVSKSSMGKMFVSPGPSLSFI
ncbi:Terpene synthase, N-terminal domain [Dillenia turbinata]|uniref:Terpene synthase, N-terminal domain n=1 Tax=Dillenia turbinata TaxID=194707 RepID=A0AAN8Z1Q7_9MAGN